MLILLTLSSCSTTTSFIDNNYRFKQAASSLNPTGIEINEQYYQDEYVTIELQQVTRNGIFLTLSNNHNSTIRLLWDEAAYVDYQGFSHRINHDSSAVSRILTMGSSISTSPDISIISTTSRGIIVDKGKIQIPDVIPAHSRINTVIIPADDAKIIRFLNLHKKKIAEEKGSNVNGLKMLNQYREQTEKTAIRLLLPFEVDGKKLEYTLTFRDEFQMYNNSSEDYYGINDGTNDAIFTLSGFAVVLLAAALLM